MNQPLLKYRHCPAVMIHLHDFQRQLHEAFAHNLPHHSTYNTENPDLVMRARLLLQCRFGPGVCFSSLMDMKREMQHYPTTPWRPS